MKRRLFIITALVAVTGLSALAMYSRRGDTAPNVQTEAISRGSIVSVVSATGTLEAVETVQVGTQVSGTVQTLAADFNSIVRKGQVLARLDPSVIQADIQRNRANVAGAEADVERIRVALADAETKLTRAQELFNRQLVPANELDAARLAKQTNEAQVKSALAQVSQARATLAQSEVNLQKTVITSPIDGIVISRAVDVGQTVAASLQAPTLFTIAADLTHMQLKASIDESDLGSIQEGQTVTFRVDAYPADVFTGVVRQVRLNPVIESNVVTYAAMIAAENPQLKLKPGMTASLTVETARRDNVLRVPSVALRFKPNAAVLAALSQPDDAASRQKAGRPVGTSGDVGAAKPAASGAARGTVWTFDGERLNSNVITIGAADSTFTEVVGGDLQEGDRAVTQAMLPGSASGTARPSTPTSNPLMGQMPRRF
ncbi:MAG TPA: efflux RND transporter periplasmic adaptor subunit [Vicinamibacterales bacterium]|nr:efflux RND transporter periplasmic adaptor subunit [Vicinamibacterales bacterium]